eukprot:COSAG06_NODE_3090_length_5874_cov_116.796710_7_plen_122_part_00
MLMASQKDAFTYRLLLAGGAGAHHNILLRQNGSLSLCLSLVLSVLSHFPYVRLSRACLGKTIVVNFKWRERWRESSSHLVDQRVARAPQQLRRVPVPHVFILYSDKTVSDDDNRFVSLLRR